MRTPLFLACAVLLLTSGAFLPVSADSQSHAPLNQATQADSPDADGEDDADDQIVLERRTFDVRWMTKLHTTHFKDQIPRLIPNVDEWDPNDPLEAEDAIDLIIEVLDYAHRGEIREVPQAGMPINTFTLEAEPDVLDAAEMIIDGLTRCMSADVQITLCTVDGSAYGRAVSDQEARQAIARGELLGELQGVPDFAMRKGNVQRLTTEYALNVSVSAGAVAHSGQNEAIFVGEEWYVRYLPRANQGGVVYGIHATHQAKDPREHSFGGNEFSTSSYHWSCRPFVLEHEPGEHPILRHDAMGRAVMLKIQHDAPPSPLILDLPTGGHCAIFQPGPSRYLMPRQWVNEDWQASAYDHVFSGYTFQEDNPLNEVWLSDRDYFEGDDA